MFINKCLWECFSLTYPIYSRNDVQICRMRQLRRVNRRNLYLHYDLYKLPSSCLLCFVEYTVRSTYHKLAYVSGFARETIEDYTTGAYSRDKKYPMSYSHSRSVCQVSSKAVQQLRRAGVTNMICFCIKIKISLFYEELVSFVNSQEIF